MLDLPSSQGKRYGRWDTHLRRQRKPFNQCPRPSTVTPEAWKHGDWTKASGGQTETRYLRPSPRRTVSQLTINTNDDDDDDNGSGDPIPRLLVSLLITSSIGPRLGSTSAVVFMAPVGSLNCGRPGWHHCAVAAAATATCRPVLSVSLGRVDRLWNCFSLRNAQQNNIRLHAIYNVFSQCLRHNNIVVAYP